MIIIAGKIMVKILFLYAYEIMDYSVIPEVKLSFQEILTFMKG